MLTIYSPVQRTHRPAYVVKQGERSASFDVPERVDSILSAINAATHSLSRLFGGELFLVPVEIDEQ
jgi:hypothetical protein